MSLLLAIETSSNKYSVVIGRDGKAVFDSSQNDGSSSLGTIAELVSHGLEVIGLPVTEIAGIAINVGPGSLTYVRAGISFVNAMAFSLGIELFPFSWFDIVARQTKGFTPIPVLCAVPAANDYAYVGLIKNSTVEIMRFGVLRTELARISEGLTKVAVAGRIRNQISSLVEAEVVDTGIETPDAQTLLELGYEALESVGNSTTQVEALNDQSEIFYERTPVHN